MGHLINPTSNRLGINSYWNSTWSTNSNFNYVLVFKKDYLLFYYFNLVFKKVFFSLQTDVTLCSYKIFRLNDKIYINMIYYMPDFLFKKFYTYYFWQLFIYRVHYKYKRRYSWQLRKLVSRKIKYLFKMTLSTLIPNIFWNVIKSSLSFNLKKLNWVKEFITFNLVTININHINVISVSHYIVQKLLQRHSLKWVLRPVLKDLNYKIKKKLIIGYKILSAGRFTRKQIASYDWSKQGRVTLSSFSHMVKFHFSKVRLKYGICGIKVWINYGNKYFNKKRTSLLRLMPLFCPFKYSLNKKLSMINLSINTWFLFHFRLHSRRKRHFNRYQDFIYFKFKIILYNFLQNVLLINPSIICLDILPKNQNNNLFIKIKIK